MLMFSINMLPKINSQTYEQCYPKRLKKFFQKNLNYKFYSTFVSKMDNATVGSIPKEIVKLFDGKEKAEKIKLFQIVLGETADAIRDFVISDEHTLLSFINAIVFVSISFKSVNRFSIISVFIVIIFFR